MAQSTTSQEASTTLADGFGETASSIRSWTSGALGKVRRTILPHPDDSLTHPTPAKPATSTSIAHRLLALIPRVMLGLFVVVFLLAIGLFAFRAVYADRIYPAVVVGDVNVGGLTPAQATLALEERANTLEQGTIMFSYQGQVWTPTLSEIGASVNLEESLAEAESLGRVGDATTRLAFTGEILREDQVVPLRTTVDLAILDSWFDKVDNDINNFAVNAEILVDGTEVSVKPDEEGVVVDREVARQQILAALASLTPVDTELPTRTDIPEIRTADLTAVQGEVAEAITTPIRVKFEDRAWKIEGATLAGYASVETVMENGEPTARLALDTERLAADLREQFGPEVNREPVDARVAWSEDQGQLIAVDPSTTGVTLRAMPFAEAVEQSFVNGHEPIDIPVVITRPAIDDENLDALGITERLGRGDSNFAGGAWGRDENIYVSTKLLNGTLVPPGGMFSFNQAIGEITADKGYQEAAVVVAEEVGRDIGGGVCQVSTTVFRAAIMAGMPIAEWHPHTYRLTNYERDSWGPGFDASILQMGSNPEYWADFKFENYTDSWLLVESWTAYPHVVVSIYGTGDGREVDLEWWGISEEKNTGFTRVIYDANGNVVAERAFASYFK
jgi:vancomycin resistance protein YoaR